MSRIIPHIYKTKIGRGLFFPLKYSDLEAYLFAKVDKDIHLDAYFYADHSYWLNRSYKPWREEKFTLVNLSYNRNDRYRFWPDWFPGDDAIVVGCRVQGLPHELAAELGLTRSILHHSITNAFVGLEADGLFSRRWQVTARLNVRERLLECASLAWQSVTPVIVMHCTIDLDQDASSGREHTQ